MTRHRVLITGGAGLVGSHVAQQLAQLDHEVVVLDNFTTYVPVPSRTADENIAYRQHVLLQDATVVTGSVTDREALHEVVARTSPTRVLHLAATPLAITARAEPLEAAHTMVQGTMQLMQALLAAPEPPRLVFASSSMAYGDFPTVPVPEHAPMQPMDVYGALKLSGEAIVRAFGRQFGLPYVIVRPSAIYGEADTNLRVVQSFLEAALSGNPVEATDPDNTCLDFTHVSDAARAMTLALLTDDVEGGSFNITRGESHSLTSLIETIRRYAPGLRVLQRPHDLTRPRRGALDISAARRRLGYEPQVSLLDGVARYVSYMREFNHRSLGLDLAV